MDIVYLNGNLGHAAVILQVSRVTGNPAQQEAYRRGVEAGKELCTYSILP